MDVFIVFLLLGVFIYLINVIPLFMPPTWIILAFFYITFHPPFLPTIIIGSGAATLGRITLYIISKKYFRRFFSFNYLKNYDALGNYFKKNVHISIPLFITYAFFPISSNYVYIAAGLTNMSIKILASSFFIGRLISYSFWVGASHEISTRFEDIFSKHLSNSGVIIFEILGLAIVVLIGKINWGKILKIKS